MKTLVIGLFTVFIALFMARTAQAISSDIVIAQVQAGALSGTGAATQEFLTIYNNSSISVEITDWCLKSNSGDVACFTPAAVNETIHLNAQSHALVASATFLAIYPETLSPEISYDVVFPVRNASSGSLVGSSDTIRLVKKDGSEVDAVSWTTTLSGGQVLARKSTTPGLLVDSDQSADFAKSSILTFPKSGVHYIQEVVDLCGNLEDVQDIMPPLFGYDEAGNCELQSADLCQNIVNIQLDYPDGMLANDLGECIVDVCQNLAGLQDAVPFGYNAEEYYCDKLEDRVLTITELLANVSGSDSGREFIEIFNPNDTPVILDGYVVSIGKLFEKSFNLNLLSEVESIKPYEYIAIYDSQLSFTLLNTQSGVRVISPAGTLVSEVYYENPKDDASWSFFDTEWSYTNQPTPGAQNMRSVIDYDEEVLSVTSSIAQCAAGKYRHPITNRCRNIENDTTMLVNCENDEYRNPETNRCRKIATLATSLTPCAEGSLRNSETNRCRKIETEVTRLAPCQSGYERNPETNRCRKSLLASSDVSGTSGQTVEVTETNTLTNSLVIAAGLSAAGYGLYEWRSEFSKVLRRLLQFRFSK